MRKEAEALKSKMIESLNTQRHRASFANRETWRMVWRGETEESILIKEIKERPQDFNGEKALLRKFLFTREHNEFFALTQIYCLLMSISVYSIYSFGLYKEDAVANTLAFFLVIILNYIVTGFIYFIVNANIAKIAREALLRKEISSITLNTLKILNIILYPILTPINQIGIFSWIKAMVKEKHNEYYKKTLVKL